MTSESIEAQIIMASLHNRNGVWYATFSDANRSPKQRRHSLKTRSRRTAERMLAKLEEAYREGGWDAWTQSPDELFHADHVREPLRLRDAVAEFLSDRKDSLSPYTLRNYRSALGIMAGVIGGGAYLDRVQSSDIARYLGAVATPGTAPAKSTQGFRLIAARSFFGWAAERGYVKASPAADVSAPSTPERLPRAVTDGELRALLSHVPEGRAWCRTLFEFAALTGLRIGELGRLKWADIDLEKRVIRIERQKNGKAQTQPIPRAAAHLLKDVERVDRYVFTAPNGRTRRRLKSWCMDVQRVFREAKEAAGIGRRITPHGLRHRYCTKLAEAGASAFVIQAAARHADVGTSQRYVAIANEALRGELDRVFGEG